MPRIVSTILFSKSHHLILFKREDPGTFRSPPAGTKGFTFRLITQPRSLILGVNDLLSDDVQGLLDAVHGDGLEDVLSDVPVLFHVDFLLGGLASLELLDDLFDKGSGERVALEVGVDVAGHDFLQARGAGVEGDEDDVAVNAVGDAGSVHGGHRAEGLVVVLADDDVELALIALAVGLHDLLAADVGEVAALGVEDGPAVLVGDLLEAVGTADGGGSASGAFNDKRVDLGDALGIGVGLQPLAGGEALILEVGANPGDILVGVVDGTVDNDDGDARVLALSQDGVPAGGDDRVNDYVVDFLLDEAADGLELGGGILVAVNEDQVVAVLRGEDLFAGVGGSGAPVGLVADLGKAYGDELAVSGVVAAGGGLLSGGLGGGSILAAAGGQREQSLPAVSGEQANREAGTFGPCD